ncbi:hypothetical protein [Chryseobacterium schmidteae]|uniref:hypothetical protein n=1 Tax=Chryseobacterium schmidteae TaxID=2730404 RepID=UPI00158B2701|nr:hypothetical protein [Chryseobacterium schmidteae]
MNKAIIFLSILCGLNANAQSSWSLTGNLGTNSNTDFLGTTDNQGLVFKTDNKERIKISQSGSVAIGENIDESYNLTTSDAKFNLNESPYSFIIKNRVSDYNIIRANTDDAILYLQESLGKVIIGSNSGLNCSDCNQYKLFVKDGIRTEKVKVDIAASNGWADYVFAKDYKLMPLKELDQFINSHGHLPEVPTTEEAIKNGIELKEMNILLLKKIEELTLYTIEQQKRIEALENKVK